ncbi:MAG: hypothetical protein EBS53_00550 [Bacteroidetes bacterium]|nr:hypothetical protein [Bacteroidota bacterium]
MIDKNKPALWNIPVRTAEGKELQRKYAEAWPGLENIDWASLETRVAATYEDLENLFRDKTKNDR